MLVLTAHIQFPASREREEIIIHQPSQVHIESGWKRLTDTAVITLPRNVEFFDKNKVRETFMANDPVTIQLGYDGDNVTEFTGYVVRASAEIPIKIYCEDLMYKIKQVPAHISLPQTTLQELLEQLLPDITIDALEVNLGAVRYANKTVATVLQDLKRDKGLYSYIQGGKLIVGKIYADNNSSTTKLHLEKNIVRHNLIYKNKDDIKILVRAVSTLSNGKKIFIDVGDLDGEIRQLTYYNIEDVESLKKLAEIDLRKYKVDGFTGDVTTFGQPVINHGEKVYIESDLYEDRSGIYYVDGVVIDWGDNAKYRRKVTIGDRVTV